MKIQGKTAREKNTWCVTDLVGDARLTPPSDLEGQNLVMYKLNFKKQKKSYRYLSNFHIVELRTFVLTITFLSVRSFLVDFEHFGSL